MSNTQSDESNKPYSKVEYYMLAIDPIHVGSGAQRLGRVDMPIVRDTLSIPKIPATSIVGPARAYSALKNGKYMYKKDDKKYSCAGKSDEEKGMHCGGCKVCYAYGYSTPDKSFQGLAHFYDAHILFFPVSTMVGPVWVTSPLALGKMDETVDDDKFYTLSDNSNIPTINGKKVLNFGWLLLEYGNANKNYLNDISLLQDYIKRRSVMVSDKLFLHIVNSNLEIRTSVSIDPATGAAEEGALFTYEAIPRGTIFKFDIIYNKPEIFGISNISSNEIIKCVESGLELFEYLGIGGMNTKGMGRLKLLK